ncbi:MAG: Wzz/FepE/Etk N-terminal domain-containing protein, partial [Thermodesulfovibrionales bacterium]
MEKKLLDYWIVLYRRRITIGLVVLGSMLTAFLLSTFLTPVYEARAVFYVPSSSPAVTYISGNSTSGLSRDKLIPLATEDDAKPYIG